MSRFARQGKVYFFEEPVYNSCWQGLRVSSPLKGLTVVTPHLYENLSQMQPEERLSSLLYQFIRTHQLDEFVCWYYSPMALNYSRSLFPALTVYDCMDELSAFKFAPDGLKEREAQLFGLADIIFTGGHTLYKLKRNFHPIVYAFPSSIDKGHFAAARKDIPDPADQRSIARPRFGFYGVLDERLNIDLIRDLARLRPEWQIILIGPVVKIDPETLPKAENIHYLGGKDYKELPSYLSGWDVAIMPFAINESTKYISPTKTPEYLAGGKPVISTSISDVVNDYGMLKMVKIADTAEEFVHAGEWFLREKNNHDWLEEVDSHLADNSWDNTWSQMYEIMVTMLNIKSVKSKVN